MAKIIVHQSKIEDREAVIKVCPFNALEFESSDELILNAACKMCKICVRRFPEIFEYVEDVEPSVNKDEWKGVTVYIDHIEGDIHPVSFELIGKAREMADKIGHPVHCLIMGHNISEIAEEVLHYGADEVFVYDKPQLHDFRIEPYTAVFEDYITKHKPTIVLVGGTTVGRSLAPRVAARFKTGLTADCTILDVQENTDLDQIRPAYGGNIMAHIHTPKHRPQFATVRYKIFNAPEKTEEKSGKLTICDIDDSKLSSKINVIEVKKKEKVKSIEDADVVVVAGRGIKKEEDLKMVYDLADELGAMVATTRPLIEAGWMDARLQIGLSGRTVKPKLIITCGVSGAIQFVAGMNNSDMIIAINENPKAQIFDVAHYAIVGDIYEIIPGLIEEIKEMKKSLMEFNMDYTPVTQQDIDKLINICGEDNVFIGEAIHEDYSRDELAGIRQYPDVVVLPINTQQVSEVLKYANDKKIAVTPRGQGTGLVGAAVAIEKGIMLTTERMNKILELDEANLTLTVEPGVLLMEISKYVEENDLFYPPDPGEKSASIGGNISTNAGGMRAVKYGVTRDYVRELEVVLASGEVITVGGKIVKDSSGYSLKDLMVGSEGTLGVITKAVLKLLPLPKVAISLLVPYPDIETAIGAVPTIIKSKAIPTAIEYMERNVILSAENYLGKQFPDNSADAYLLLTFDGNNKADVEKVYEQVAHVCLDTGAKDVFISDTDERNESIWSARGAFLEAIKASTTEMDECDVVVPRNFVADFINYTKVVEKELDVRIASFGHAGDGNLHVYVLKDDMTDEQFVKKLSDAFDLLYSKGEELGGHVSGEHGIGFAKKPYLEKMAGEVYMNLLKGIKKTFDPNLILNPGKVC